MPNKSTSFNATGQHRKIEFLNANNLNQKFCGNFGNFQRQGRARTSVTPQADIRSDKKTTFDKICMKVCFKDNCGSSHFTYDSNIMCNRHLVVFTPIQFRITIMPDVLSDRHWIFWATFVIFFFIFSLSALPHFHHSKKQPNKLIFKSIDFRNCSK